MTNDLIDKILSLKRNEVRKTLMIRHYQKLSQEGTYWNIRVPVCFKEKAREFASILGVSPSSIARDGIERELIRLNGGKSLYREEEDGDGEAGAEEAEVSNES